MATPKSQRIAIMTILVVTVVGTLGSFAVMILNTQNTQSDSRSQQDAYAKYQEDIAAYQEQLDAQAIVLSKQYYPIFKKYADSPAEFDIDSVTGLEKRDLLVGTGEEIAGSTSFAAYYIGWNPEGVVFDQSISDDDLKSPFNINGLEAASLIEGWKEGLVGMKVGGVRELTIPSDLAYGEEGSGDNIPPNTPIKFVVMAISQPEKIPEPEVPSVLLQ